MSISILPSRQANAIFGSPSCAIVMALLQKSKTIPTKDKLYLFISMLHGFNLVESVSEKKRRLKECVFFRGEVCV
jgi:hypothetical protein